MISRANTAAAPQSHLRVDYQKLPGLSGDVMVNVSRLRGCGGVTEWHITVTPSLAGSSGEHLHQVEHAYRAALDALGLDLTTVVWRRFFCSDIANQASILRGHAFSDPACLDDPCAVSHVGQAPLTGAKLALWAHHIEDPAGSLDKSCDGTTLTLCRGDLRHLWSAQMFGLDEKSTSSQTQAVFSDYAARLRAHGLTLADHVVRTWLFQPNINLDYHDMVTTRREFFASQGLTADTHFIASTGICGAHALPHTRVFMDAYAVGGLRHEQVAYLAALDHLGPTYDYGVTFERATSVTYRDRKQIFISGTASIGPSGEILHPGDVAAQLDRTLLNIDALLVAAGAGLADILMFIVYLRDPSDYARVMPILKERLGDAPMVVLAAHVCRPGWLIEIEGIAGIAGDYPDMPEF